MRTSASQFELLVTFMQQYGDLSKPTSDANGRIQNLRLWERLTGILNSDGSGATKTVEKWKKVWSDFKNNTKKKAARIHRAASGTGGGPANLTKLSDLEQRVLNLIGIQVATGLAVAEAGLAQRNVNVTAVQEASLLNFETVDSAQPWDEPGPSHRPHMAPPLPEPPRPIVIEETEITQPFTPVPSNQSPETPMRIIVSPRIELQDADMLTPTRLSPVTRQRTSTPIQPALSGQTERVSSRLHVGSAQPAQSAQTPPRARPARGTPRRLRGTPSRVRLTQTEQATQLFLRQDEQWRKFKMEQHRDYMELKREQLQTQRDWQSLANRTLDILEKLANKFCN